MCNGEDGEDKIGRADVEMQCYVLRQVRLQLLLNTTNKQTNKQTSSTVDNTHSSESLPPSKLLALVKHDTI